MKISPTNPGFKAFWLLGIGLVSGLLSASVTQAQVFDATISNTTYGSGQTKTEEASNHLTTNAAVVVQSGANITFTAGKSIKLEPGFHAEGATFHAFIGAQADSDEDGMTDAWEIANGFDPNNPADAPADADGDGLSNVTEFKLGTSPHTAAVTNNQNVQLKVLLPTP